MQAVGPSLLERFFQRSRGRGWEKLVEENAALLHETCIPALPENCRSIMAIESRFGSFTTMVGGMSPGKLPSKSAKSYREERRAPDRLRLRRGLGGRRAPGQAWVRACRMGGGTSNPWAPWD